MLLTYLLLLTALIAHLFMDLHKQGLHRPIKHWLSATLVIAVSCDRFRVVFGPPIPDSEMPKFGKVYTVEKYPFADQPCHAKRHFLLLSEIPTALFFENAFEPLVPTDQLEEDLWEIQTLGQKLSDG